MKRWADCASEQERRAVYAEAVELCGGSMGAVAVVLGVNRQHVYRLRERYGTAGPKRSHEAEAGERTTRILLDLPKRCVDWLETEALKRKQAGAAGRMAKSPIVVELIERAMGR